MEKKLQNKYYTFYNLLMAQDLWQAHYQNLSIILQTELINLNVNTNKKNVKRGNKYIKISSVFLNTQTWFKKEYKMLIL